MKGYVRKIPVKLVCRKGSYNPWNYASYLVIGRRHKFCSFGDSVSDCLKEAVKQIVGSRP